MQRKLKTVAFGALLVLITYLVLSNSVKRRPAESPRPVVSPNGDIIVPGNDNVKVVGEMPPATGTASAPR